LNVEGLRGRRIAVSGATSGIGRSLLLELVESGATVAAVGRGLSRIELTSEQEVVLCEVDMRDPYAVAGAVEEAAEQMGGLDAIVNNAGVIRPGGVGETEPTDWLEMIQVNLLAVLAASKAAIPHLERSGRGQIINLGSMSGRRVGSAETGVYAATKHAVGQALRLELHGRGVRVSTIAPGYVRTGFGARDQSPRTGHPLPDEEAKGLNVRDVVAQVIHVLKAPVDVSITEIAMVSVEQDPW